MPNDKPENEAQKQAILDAAAAEFSQKGYAKASVRQIAQAAGVTTGAIYYYYKDKGDLLVDVMNSHVHYVHSLYEFDENGQKKEPAAFLRDITAGTVERLGNTEWQRLHLMLAGEIASSDEKTKREHRESYEETIQKVGDYLSFALGVPDDPRKYMVASVLVAALDGMAVQSSFGMYADNMDQMSALFNDFFVKSITAYLSEGADEQGESDQ